MCFTVIGVMAFYSSFQSVVRNVKQIEKLIMLKKVFL